MILIIILKHRQLQNHIVIQKEVVVKVQEVEAFRLANNEKG